MVESLRVSLAERSYDIEFTDALPSRLDASVKEATSSGRRIATITDRKVAACQAALLRPLAEAGPVIDIPAGEKSKSISQLGRLLEALAAARLDRTGIVYAVGGGVVGDIAGFAAASYLRGIEYRQVPTTLLAMVDSSVGGKTGVNLGAGKNLAGAFHQPREVLISTAVLATLPRRQFAAGCAEIIKYGLLGDALLFARLEKKALRRPAGDLAAIIRQCCAAKAAIVARDEQETATDGGRALLNLGHTFGHAIEQVTGYRAYLHGEAVAIGLCAAARLSQDLGYIGKAEVERIERSVAAHALPTRLRETLPLADLQAAAARDKKVRAGVARYVVLRGIGQAAVEQVPEAPVVEAFRHIGAK